MSNRTVQSNNNGVCQDQSIDNRLTESFGHPLSTSTAVNVPKIDVNVLPPQANHTVPLSVPLPSSTASTSAVSNNPTPSIPVLPVPVTTTTNTTTTTPTPSPQHQHFINVPVPQNTNSNANVNILQQLNLPPLPPVATTTTTPIAPVTPAAPLALVVPPPPPTAFQPVQPVPPMSVTAIPMTNMQAAKLNPKAATFTPNPCANIPMPQTQETSPANSESTSSVQGSTNNQTNTTPTNINEAQISAQIEQLKQKVQESLHKLQFFASQLNTLQMLNQHNQTLQTLQQYQTVYQQYQIELANTVLLNQYMANLNNLSSLHKLQSEQTNQQPQKVNANANTSTSTNNNGGVVKSPSPQTAAGPVNKLETIEEGEEEEMQDGDEIAAPAPVCNGNQEQQGADQEDEGNEEMKAQEMTETNTSSAIGEPVENVGNFLKFPNPSSGSQMHTNGNSTVEIGERGVNLNKSPSDLAKIKKQIRGILNKITPENFAKLSQEISSILKLADIADGLDKELSAEQLRAAQKAQFKALIRLILKCILEKAIIEPMFSNQYARLCYSLYLYAESNEMKKKVFRLQLISLCHNVFNRARNSAESARFIGIVTMIGELFAYGLISWRVINAGIFEELLPPTQALDIEAVCKLLKTSGHNFDRHHYEEINHVINTLSTHAQNFDFRTQCLVKEISEMRKNDWKQRKDIKPESPKLLSQVHREFHQEKAARKSVPTPANSYQRVAAQQPQQQQQQQRPQRYINNNHVNNYQRGSSYGAPRNNNYNGNNHRWRGNGHHSRYNNNGNASYGGRYNSRYNNNHHAYPQRRRGGKSLRPTVEFVKDVTLPDRSHYPANKLLTKTWAMRNSGELPWGDDVELVYFKGDETLSLQSRYPVMNAAPGQEVQLSANIRTPRAPGRYCTYFRLQKNGKFFGPRVWVDIIVSDSSSQQDGHGEVTKNCGVSSSAQNGNNNHQPAGVEVGCQ